MYGDEGYHLVMTMVQLQTPIKFKDAAIAQLVEHLTCNQDVRDSTSRGSTIE